MNRIEMEVRISFILVGILVKLLLILLIFPMISNLILGNLQLNKFLNHLKVLVFLAKLINNRILKFPKKV